MEQTTNRGPRSEGFSAVGKATEADAATEIGVS